MDTLSIALEWLQQGINPVPLQPNTKYMLDGDKWRNYDRLHDLPEVVKVFNGKHFNLGIYPAFSPVTKKYLVVLDFDHIYLKSDEDEKYIVETGTQLWWKWYTTTRIETRTDTTKRGKHCYFWCEHEPDKQLRSDICEIIYRRPIAVPPSKRGDFVYSCDGREIKEIKRIEDIIECYTPASRAMLATPAIQREKEKDAQVFSFTLGSEGAARTHYSFNQVKQSVNLLDYLSTYHKLPDDTSGKFISCYCPVHNDNGHPSLSVNPSKGLCKCNVPSCKLSLGWYDVIGLHAKITGLNNGQAAGDLMAKFA